MEGIKKINTAKTPKTPRGNSSPTFEQLLQGDSSKWASSCSPTSAKEHDQQEDQFGHHNKKSVLTKVKETAKKLKHSLSKKKHGHEDTGSPTSCIALEDEEEDDNAPEFLGAPMYESEQAPEACKETIRQQPREVPIVSEKHILTSSIAAENKDQIGHGYKIENHKANENLSKNLNDYQKANGILNKNRNENQKANEILNKNIKEKAHISQNYGIISETKPGNVSGNYGMQNLENKQGDYGMQNLGNKQGDVSGNYGMQNLEKGGQQTWDKGVSVKEYLMQKFEPGENERALSEVITEAISPRKTPAPAPARREMGVVEMVKEAVTSLLRNEEPVTQPIINSSSPPIPISTHPQVTEEENHGRVLQAN